MVIGRHFAGRVCKRAFDRLRIVDKLHARELREHSRRQAFPSEIGCAVQAHAKLEAGAFSMNNSSDNMINHLEDEGFAIAHEPLGFADARLHDGRIECRVARMLAKAKGDTSGARIAAQVADTSAAVRGHVIDGVEPSEFLRFTALWDCRH